MLIPVLPVYINELGGSALQASLATSLFAISGLIFRSLTGKGVDKYGRRPLLILGFFMLFLLNISLFWFSAVAIILVLRFIHGMGWGMTSTSIATVMSDTVPAKRRGEGTGYYALSVILGTCLSPMLAIALMAHFDFKIVLTVSSAAILIGFLLAQGISIKKQKQDEAKEIQKTKGSFWSDLFEKRALLPSFLCLLLAIPFGALMSYIMVFGEEVGIKHVWLYYIGHCLMIIISRPFIGKLFDRKGHVYAILPGVISMFIGLVILSVTTNAFMLVLSSIFFGFGFGAAQPSLQAWAVNRSPEHRKGAANGTFLSAMDLGAALGIFFLGMVGSVTGYHMMFLIGSIFILALIIIYGGHLLKNRRSQMEDIQDQAV